MWNQQNTQATFANNMQALQNGLLTPQQWQLVQAMGGNINWQTIADMPTSTRHNRDHDNRTVGHGREF